MITDLILRFIGETGDLNAKVAQVQRELGKVGSTSKSTGSKLADIGKAATAAIAGSALAVGGFAVHMADEFEQAHARLVVALKNSGTSWAAQKDAIDKVEASARKLGFTDTDTEGALAVMTRGMGNATTAIKYLGVAQDLARAKNIDLSQAGLLVTRAYEGQLRPLKQLGIDLPIQAGGAAKVQKAQEALVKATAKLNSVNTAIHDGLIKGKSAWFAHATAVQGVTDAQAKLNVLQHTGATVLNDLSKVLHGTAAASAETFAGKQRVLKAEIDHVAVSLGEVLIPIIEKVASITANLVQWLEKHKAAAQALAIVLGVVAGALLAVGVAAFIAENALTLGIGAAIALLVVGIVEFADHWDTIWAAVTGAVGDAIDWLKAHWPLILGILTGPIGLAVVEIVQHWDTVVSFFKGLPGRLLRALGSFGQKLIQWMGSAFLSLVQNMPKIIGGLIGFTLGLPIRLVAALLKFDILLIGWMQQAFVGLVTNMPKIIGGLLVFTASIVDKIITTVAGLELQLVLWAASAFVGFVKALPNLIGDLLKWFGNLPNTLIQAMGDIVSAFLSVGEAIIKGIINGIANAAGGLGGALGGAITSAVDQLPGGKSIAHFLHLPGAAAGGVITRPTVLVAGEAGPEAIIPLSRARSAFPSSGRELTVNVTINNPTGDGRQIADQLYTALRTGHRKRELSGLLA